ncbi:MAG: hypothetical protein M4579_002199 [Chaenotheca gracillima]|nr:MAG: hypothetical protein M4579_002199 [Chaenotheca gracillima]
MNFQPRTEKKAELLMTQIQQEITAGKKKSAQPGHNDYHVILSQRCWGRWDRWRSGSPSRLKGSMDDSPDIQLQSELLTVEQRIELYESVDDGSDKSSTPLNGSSGSERTVAETLDQLSTPWQVAIINCRNAMHFMGSLQTRLNGCIENRDFAEGAQVLADLKESQGVCRQLLAEVEAEERKLKELPN